MGWGEGRGEGGGEGEGGTGVKGGEVRYWRGAGNFLGYADVAD